MASCGMNTVVTRLKDGLFVGAVDLAVNEVFLREQRVTHVVHCTFHGKENEIKSSLAKYFVLHWNTKSTKLFKSKADARSTVQAMASFMAQAQSKGDSVIVVSHKERELALVVCIFYFMLRFGWTYAKSIKLIRNKVDFRGFRPRKTVRDQIKHYQSSLLNVRILLNPKAAVITENTLKNHLSKASTSSKRSNSKKNCNRRISWIDDPINHAEHNSLTRSPFSKKILPERSPVQIHPRPTTDNVPEDEVSEGSSASTLTGRGEASAERELLGLKIDADPRRLLRAITQSHTRLHVRSKLLAKGLI